MIKIKLIESGFHTLYPYKKAANEFKSIGIEIGGDEMDSYDFAFVDHQTFSNKKVSMQQNIDEGLEKLSKITGDYILVDGQDSPSVIGTFEVFKESNALLMLKHSLYKDRSLYNQGWIGGRMYWGTNWEHFDKYKYQPKDFDNFSHRIQLAGTNWIGTVSPQWMDYSSIQKLFDVSAMFQYPHPDCHEHGLLPSQDYYYNEHRRPVLEIMDRSPFMVAKLYKGRRVDAKVYYEYLKQSKIILAPFGYGEMAPRDLESAMIGSILIKPDMSHIDSQPFIYEDGKTYIACKHDYSDLEEKIEYCMENFDELRNHLVQNMRRVYDEQYHPFYLPLYTYELFKKNGFAK